MATVDGDLRHDRPSTEHSSDHNEKDLGTLSTPAALEILSDPDADKSPAEKAEIDRKLVFKLDMIIIPWLCLLYLLAFLDRTNIGNAKIDNLQGTVLRDGKAMTNGDYNATLSIFFVSYAIFEPLTNVLLKKLRPRIFIPLMLIAWGLVMTLMGLVKNWSGLMAARWFLGVAEAGLFPGVNYYLSCWYKRNEFGIRAAIFFSAAAVSGSFGGLLAAAITKMEGIAGLYGWSWLFILEGIVTVIFGVASFWMVHDFPDKANFLSPTNRLRLVRRLNEDRQSSAHHEDFKMADFYNAMKDYKMWIGMVIYMGADMPLYAFSLFLPTIIKDLGNGEYSQTQSQLLTVPVYAAAAILTILVGWYADRTNQRGLCNLVASAIGIAGFSMLISTADPHVQYAGCFLGALGIYPCIANTIAWTGNNIEGSYKRGVVLGFVIGWGNINGIVSSNIYNSTDAPKFPTGNGVVLAYMSLFLFGGSAVLHLLLRRENSLRRAGKRDHWVAGMNEKEKDALGDMRPDFLYIL